MFNRRPLMLIIKEIENKIKEKEFSVRSLEYELDKRGYKEINRGRIYRTFYIKEGAQSFLNGTDDTIEGVLTVLGITSEDLMRDIIRREESNYPEDVKEIMEFVRKPEAIPYLKLAYAQYRAKQAALEVERIEKELSDTSPK